jgi:hypothetical protein
VKADFTAEEEEAVLREYPWVKVMKEQAELKMAEYNSRASPSDTTGP